MCSMAQGSCHQPCTVLQSVNLQSFHTAKSGPKVQHVPDHFSKTNCVGSKQPLVSMYCCKHTACSCRRNAGWYREAPKHSPGQRGATCSQRFCVSITVHLQQSARCQQREGNPHKPHSNTSAGPPTCWRAAVPVGSTCRWSRPCRGAGCHARFQSMLGASLPRRPPVQTALVPNGETDQIRCRSDCDGHRCAKDWLGRSTPAIC